MLFFIQSSDLGEKYGPARLLTSADDLNNITNNGTYWYWTDSVPANAPYDNASIVEVVGSKSSTTQKLQRITRFGVAGQSAWRALDSDGWKDWAYNLTNADIPDSGWISCTLKSGITTATNNYGGKSKLSYRKIGNQVHIVGGVGITNYTGNTVISSLPIAYRPETTHYWLSPLTGSRIARCIIGSGGDLVIEWIKNISDGSDYTGNVSWIDMSGVFFAR